MRTEGVRFRPDKVLQKEGQSSAKASSPRGRGDVHGGQARVYVTKKPVFQADFVTLRPISENEIYADEESSCSNRVGS